MPSREPQQKAKPKSRSLLDASDAGPPTLHRRAGGNAELAGLKESLRRAGVFAPCSGYYPRKLAEVLALWGFAVAALLALRHSAWVLLVGPLLALTTGQTVLLAHEVVHGAAFARGSRSSFLRRFVPHFLIGGLAGGSSSWWKQSHNTHHVLSNDPALDPDIDYPFLAFELAQAREKPPIFQPILRYQHLLIWFMLPAVAITMRVYSIAFLLRRLTRRGVPRSSHALELLMLALHWVAYAWLICRLPLALGFGVVLAHQAGFAVYLGLITASNHWGMPMPNAQVLSFVEHQVITSRNISGGKLVRFLYGGLDAQIEHHLFMGIARPRLYEARPLVRAFCLQRGITYAEESPFEALRQVYQRLRSVALELRAADLVPSQGVRLSGS